MNIENALDTFDAVFSHNFALTSIGLVSCSGIAFHLFRQHIDVFLLFRIELWNDDWIIVNFICFITRKWISAISFSTSIKSLHFFAFRSLPVPIEMKTRKNGILATVFICIQKHIWISKNTLTLFTLSAAKPFRCDERFSVFFFIHVATINSFTWQICDCRRRWFFMIFFFFFLLGMNFTNFNHSNNNNSRRPENEIIKWTEKQCRDFSLSFLVGFRLILLSLMNEQQERKCELKRIGTTRNHYRHVPKFSIVSKLPLMSSMTNRMECAGDKMSSRARANLKTMYEWLANPQTE